MARNRTFTFVLTMSLLCAAFVQALGQAAKTVPTVVAGAALALPAKCKVKTRWVCPPLDGKLVAATPWYDMCFAVDNADRPWIGYQDDTIISPTRQYRFKLAKQFNSMVCLENGAFLVATASDLGFVVPPAKLETNYDNLPVALFQPIANLPAPECKMFAGAGDCLYLVAGRNDGGSDVYLLRAEKSGPRGFTRIFTSKTEVSLVAGDGNTTYVAMESFIAKISGADGKVSKIFASPQEYIVGMAYSPQAGLFYTTSRGIGYIGSKCSGQLMTAADTMIYLQKGTLYVLFKKSLGVLALDNIQDLQRFIPAAKAVPADQSKDVKVTDIRFFESGKNPPAYADRRYDTKFEREVTRFVCCQIDLQNLQYKKRAHNQAVTMELWKDGKDYPLESHDVVFGIAADMQGVAGWSFFGAETPGSLYPGTYVVRTSLNGGRIDERRFTVTGEVTLVEAAANEDIATVRKLLGSGSDVKTADKDGNTPLMVAVQTGNIEIAKLLLNSGADVKAKNGAGETALTLAAEQWDDDPTIIQLLLSSGADVNAQGTDGMTALRKAVYRDLEVVTRLLLDHGADPNIKDKDGRTPLQAMGLDLDLHADKKAVNVELLLSHGADPEVKDKYGNTVIFSAVEGKNLDAVSALIKHGANVKTVGSAYGVTEQTVLGRALETYRMFDDRLGRVRLRQIAGLLQEQGVDLGSVEAQSAYFAGIDQVLDPKHMGQVLRASESAARAFQPDDPVLRKADIAGLLAAAYHEISQSTDGYGYYGALNSCEEAKKRAQKWGLTSSCPEISFDMGVISMHLGNTDDAKKFLNEYLQLAPNGYSAGRARELLGLL